MPYFNRFDVVEAHYAFYCDWHSGQSDTFYQRLCRMESYFKPGLMFNGYQNLSENGMLIYQNLMDQYQKPHHYIPN